MDTLRKELAIPVWHDDQQGTAGGASLAGLYNALKLTNRRIEDTTIVLYGAGASNIATARLLMTAGAKPGNIILVDSKGAAARRERRYGSLDVEPSMEVRFGVED